MDKEAICPWCENKTIPAIAMVANEFGTIRERRCTHCGKVLAAYLADEGPFMQSVRKYEN